MKLFAVRNVTKCRQCGVVTYLHYYVCVQWNRPFRSWSKLVLSSQTVPPKNLRFLIAAECSLTGYEQRQPLGCAQPQLHRRTGRPHVHVVLAHCCQSALRVHHWEWGCCPPAPPVRLCQWIARYVGHTVWGSGPFRGYRQGCLHRAVDRGVQRWGCWSLTGRGKGHGAHGYRSHSSGASPTQQVRVDEQWSDEKETWWRRRVMVTFLHHSASSLHDFLSLRIRARDTGPCCSPPWKSLPF